MTALRVLPALLLCSAAARAADPQLLIDRPITLPQGKVDLTLHGTYTNWSSGVFGLTAGSFDGETLALGVDVGATDRVQLGLGVALPIHPGASFGSVLLSGLFSSGDPRFAVRLDGGYERVGVNGDPTQANVSQSNRYFGGLGAAIKVPITGAVAFVTGRNGAVSFGHFNNVGGGTTGLYFGASDFSQASSDFLVISGGNGGTSPIVGINLPAGLLVQPDPQLAITLQAGYSAVFVTSGVTGTLHFIPLALEAIVTPAPALDIGARFSLDGYVGASDARLLDAGYFDLRAVMFWLCVHV